VRGTLVGPQIKLRLKKGGNGEKIPDPLRGGGLPDATGSPGCIDEQKNHGGGGGREMQKKTCGKEIRGRGL